MAASISLATYLAFARRSSARGIDKSVPRPIGELVWLHCADLSRARTFARLGRRLMAQREGLTVLLTTSRASGAAPDLPDQIIWQEAPSESPADIEAFLEFWKPDACLWLGPWLRPSLIHAATRKNVPLILVDARDLGVENKRWRWLPEPIRGTLQLFSYILAHDANTASRLKRMALEDTHISVSGALTDEGTALSCNETDLEELTTLLAGRPAWLAAHVQPAELPTILQAQRATLRMSHRLLLILSAATPKEADIMLETVRKEGWRVGFWDDGDMPGEDIQILVTSDPQELGLWYRVAPVTLMCSSLKGGFGGRNPLDPAALGSAILYGPGIGNHLNTYSRLAKAGAARIVKDTDSLGTALALLLAPDQVASMAHAGWAVMSEGAEVSNRIAELVHLVLDNVEANT